MNGLRRNNIHMITLDVRISCDTFWDYKFNIPIRIDDYYNENINNNNINNNTNNNNNNTRRNTHTDTC